jgi:hypothetical protein
MLLFFIIVNLFFIIVNLFFIIKLYYYYHIIQQFQKKSLL